MATITLSQRLRGDTTYYYILSVPSDNSSLHVRVQGRFCLSMYVLSKICALYDTGLALSGTSL